MFCKPILNSLTQRSFWMAVGTALTLGSSSLAQDSAAWQPASPLSFPLLSLPFPCLFPLPSSFPFLSLPLPFLWAEWGGSPCGLDRGYILG